MVRTTNTQLRSPNDGYQRKDKDNDAALPTTMLRCRSPEQNLNTTPIWTRRVLRHREGRFGTGLGVGAASIGSGTNGVATGSSPRKTGTWKRGNLRGPRARARDGMASRRRRVRIETRLSAKRGPRDGCGPIANRIDVFDLELILIGRFALDVSGDER